MEINSEDMLLEVLKGMWEMKELYFMLLGMVAIALFFRVTVDLMSQRSKIKWFLGKKRFRSCKI